MHTVAHIIKMQIVFTWRLVLGARPVHPACVRRSAQAGFTVSVSKRANGIIS